MSWEGWFALGVTVSVLGTLISARLAPHMVMLGALALLSISGVLTPSEALVGFSNPGVLTVMVMFVMAAGIHASGGIELLLEKVLGRPNSERHALLRIFVPVTLLSAFLNNTPVVATMIPALRGWAKRIDIAPSKLMIPLSYAAILGGMVTLIGTSTNLVVNGQYQALTGEPGFALFDITIIGLPIAICGLLFMGIFFPRWLPNYRDNEAFGSLREFTLEVMVNAHGPLAGKTITEAGLRNLKRIFLTEIERDGKTLTAVSPDETLQGNDRLVFAGDTDAISDLLKINGLQPPKEQEGDAPVVAKNGERKLVEVVVSNHCTAIGHAIRDAQFRNRYGAVVLAVARNGERVRGNLGSIKLRAGDTLLLQTSPAFMARQRHSRDFLLANELDHDQPRHEKACLAWGILVGVVAAAGLGWLTMLNAALLGAGAMLLTGCLTVNQAERSIDYSVFVTIAASFALGSALDKTGVAHQLAQQIITVSSGHPFLMLLLTYLMVSVLTEMITNNAAAILMLPIVLQMTQQTGLAAEPFVFAIMMAASASFATPLGYQTNLMVYGPGNYKFRDFIKVGLPMNVFIGTISVVLIYLLFPLS